MTKQQYIDSFVGKTIDECAEFCHEHDVHVRLEVIDPLRREVESLRRKIDFGFAKEADAMLVPLRALLRREIEHNAACEQEIAQLRKKLLDMKGGSNA